MDDTDKAILNQIQSDFPVTSRPFLEIAKHLNLKEQEVIKRLTRLKKRGIIRRIGGNFNPEKLGFTSTLCAARVPKDKIDKFVEVVNSYHGVTHNYRRNHDYNIWFTFIAESREKIKKYLYEISLKTGVTEIHNLPAVRVFKIKAQFEV